MGNVQKSFTTMGLGVILSNVTNAVIEAEKKAKSSKEIQTLDVLRPGLRQDIYIGKVMVVPPTVMDDPDKVPLPLFKGAILNLFDAETAASYDSHRLAESEFDQLNNRDFSLFKDTVFKDEEGKYTCIVMFLPAWSNPRDYVGFKFEKDVTKLEQLIRHLVFSAYFNPSLSALFDTLEEAEIKLDAKSIQHDHFGPTFDLMSASNTYPLLERGKVAAAKKPFIRFAASELDTIKDELLSPEEKAVLDQLSDTIKSKVASPSTCEGCGNPSENGALLCADCQAKEKLSLEDEGEDSVEALAQEVATEARGMIDDTYLSSSEDTMGLIENVDDTTYDESMESAIYEVMALKSVPYDLAEAVAERAKEIITGEAGSSVHDEMGEDIDIDTLADDSLPPDLQAELDAIDEESGWEKPVTSSKVKHSFIDFFTKCKGCGALTSVPPGTTDQELVFCTSCDGVSKDLDAHPFEEKEAQGVEECPSCATTEAFVDDKISSKTATEDDKLARKIFWQCFDNKTSATMAQIHKCVGENFAEIQKAMMYLWRRNYVTPAEKLNTWTKVGPDTEKNTFNGKWPWNVHQAANKTAFQEYWCQPEGDKWAVLHTKDGKQGEFTSESEAEAEVKRLNTAKGEEHSKKAGGVVEVPKGDFPEPKRKEIEQSSRPEEKVKAKKYNDPARKVEIPKKKMGGIKLAEDEKKPYPEIERPEDPTGETGLRSRPDYGSPESKEGSPKCGGLKSFRRSLRPGLTNKTAASFTYEHPGDAVKKLDIDTPPDMLLTQDDGVKAPDINIKKKNSHYRKLAFDWMAPDQVLKDFYPEVRNELQTHLHDKDDYHPIKPDEQEREGGANQDINLDENEAEEKHSLTSPGLVSTEEGGGAPLRSRERNIRGPFFMDQFYKIHADIPASQLTVKSSLNKKAAETNRVELVEQYLTSLAAEISSSLLAAFVVDPKLNFIDVPTEGTIDLKASPSIFMNPMLSKDVLNPIISQLSSFFNSLNDNELTDAINNSWSQSAVWKENGKNGFLYEIFVRIESVDVDNMTITYRFVASKKEK